VPVLTDIPESHELGPFFGHESLGYHAICDCGARFDGATPAEVVDYYEQHHAAISLAPGVGKARAALAEALTRKAGAA
jgi:hypothetical protein